MSKFGTALARADSRISSPACLGLLRFASFAGEGAGMRRVLRRGGAACYARAMTTISRRLKSATMKAGGQHAELEDQVGRYALRRGLGTWEVTFEGWRASVSSHY
jgi:hypothetical protein